MHDDNDQQAPAGKRQQGYVLTSCQHLRSAGCSHFCRSATRNPLVSTEPGGLSASLSRDGSRHRGRGALLYLTYQMQSDIMAPVRRWASGAANSGSAPVLADNPALRNLTAVYELIARSGLTHMRPRFGIDSITVDGREVEVREKAAARTPFGTLLHFSKDTAATQPRVLLVAPLSGHFSTLLRATVRTMLPEHDVFVTDWHNARD